MCEGLLPSSAWDLFERLDKIEELDEDQIAFTVAGVLALASHSAGLLSSSSPGENFSLFFSFTSSIDEKLDPKRTFRRLCGSFLNYSMDKIKKPLKVTPCVADKSIKKLMVSLERALTRTDDNTARKVVKGMLGVRDAAYLYVYMPVEKLKEIFKDGRLVLNCPKKDEGGD